MTGGVSLAEADGGDSAVPSLLDLDDPACRKEEVSGGKGAWLARGLAAGLPVLPGLVVTAATSERAMAIGVDALARRGSGGARLEVSAARLPPGLADEIATRSAALADALVVRSSSLLEDSAEWAGAFTSYLDVAPNEVPRAVTGCWASAFNVSTLERHEAAGIAPGSKGMAVLLQPALNPEFGGTARLEDGCVVITAVAGSPAPLLQGWETGIEARVTSDGTVGGDGALALMGETALLAVAEALEGAGRVGADQCEWAVVEGIVVLLQMMKSRRPQSEPVVALAGDALAGPQVADLARLVRRFPGPLGEALVLPWAVGNPRLASIETEPLDMASAEALVAARQHAAALTAEVWG
ncbi:MAG TPA: PEP/pyruvate-binding domain-containing protein, partial [Acidimicrobiia bacterium]|nr:PEP/pyruvate-binding domain-containing protein [Acidimicrobiia bacterium]